MERKYLVNGALVSLAVSLGILAKTDSPNLDELTCPVTSQLNDELQEDVRGTDRVPFRIVDKNEFEKATENLRASIAWMKSLENPDIREAAVCIEDEINETNFSISANNKKAAFVGVAPDPQRPQVLFSIKTLSSEEFTRLEGAIDIFEAYYIYRRALENPKKFTSDLANQLSILEKEASTASSQAFSSIEQVNHN